MRISRVKEFLKRRGLLQAPCAPNKAGRGRQCSLLDGHGARAGAAVWEGSGGTRGGTSWGEQASASVAWEVSPEDRRGGGAEEPAPPGPRGKGLRGARVRSGGQAFRPGESRVELGSASKYSGVLGEFLEERMVGEGGEGRFTLDEPPSLGAPGSKAERAGGPRVGLDKQCRRMLGGGMRGSIFRPGKSAHDPDRNSTNSGCCLEIAALWK